MSTEALVVSNKLYKRLKTVAKEQQITIKRLVENLIQKMLLKEGKKE